MRWLCCSVGPHSSQDSLWLLQEPRVRHLGLDSVSHCVAWAGSPGSALNHMCVPCIWHTVSAPHACCFSWDVFIKLPLRHLKYFLLFVSVIPKFVHWLYMLPAFMLRVYYR